MQFFLGLIHTVNNSHSISLQLTLFFSKDIKKWSINKNKDFVTVEIPVFKAEKLLNTKYHTWRHEET